MSQNSVTLSKMKVIVNNKRDSSKRIYFEVLRSSGLAIEEIEDFAFKFYVA